MKNKMNYSRHILFASQAICVCGNDIITLNNKRVIRSFIARIRALITRIRT